MVDVFFRSLPDIIRLDLGDLRSGADIALGPRKLLRPADGTFRTRAGKATTAGISLSGCALRATGKNGIPLPQFSRMQQPRLWVGWSLPSDKTMSLGA